MRLEFSADCDWARALHSSQSMGKQGVLVLAMMAVVALGSGCVTTTDGIPAAGASSSGGADLNYPNAPAGGGDGKGGTAGTQGSPSTGIFFSTFAGTLSAVDIATGVETSTKLDDRSNGAVGIGGGVIADVVKPSTTSLQMIVVLRKYEKKVFTIVEQIGPIDFPADEVWGIASPSPDNASIFLMPTREDEDDGVHWYIRAMDRKGKMLGKIDNAYSPSWISAGRAVYAADDGIFSVGVSPTAGFGTPERIGKPGLGSPDRGPSGPKISPDGKSLVFAQADMIWRINLDGTNLTQLTAQRPKQSNPVFSPDGSMVAVQYGECRTTWGEELLVSANPGSADPPDPLLTQPKRLTRLRPDLPKEGERYNIPACGAVWWLAQ